MRYIILALLIIIAGCGTEDCGTSSSIAQGRATDDALTCLGTNLMECAPAKAVINTGTIDGIHYEILGKKDTVCGVKIRYDDDKDLIKADNMKEIAGLELICYLRTETTNNPETYAATIMGEMAKMAKEGKCTGSFADAMKNKEN